jgi:hypothetical protein
MSGDATPNLDLQYLDPSQAQPEVKINDAWNKIDAAIGTGLQITDIGESPPATINAVHKLTFEGASVSSESDNGVLVQIDDAGVVREASWTNALGAISIPINSVIRYSGAKRKIKEVVVLTQGGPGSCVIEIWKAKITDHYPPVSADDITGGANVVISAGTTHMDSALSGWETDLGQDDALLLTLSASSTFTNVTISLRLG